MIAGYGPFRDKDDELKNETIQVTKSMFKNWVLKLPRVEDWEWNEVFWNASYKVYGYGGDRITVHPDGVEIQALFTPLGSEKSLYDDAEWWQSG